MRIQLFAAIVALATASPLQTRAATNCTALTDFKIQTTGGCKPGYYLAIDGEQLLVEVTTPDAANATIWTLSPRGVLTVGAAQSGVGRGTPATLFKRSYNDGFIYVEPRKYAKQVNIFCTLPARAAADGTCPLACSATIKGGVAFDYEYTWDAGGTCQADLGVQNPYDRFTKTVQFVALSVES